METDAANPRLPSRWLHTCDADTTASRASDRKTTPPRRPPAAPASYKKCRGSRRSDGKAPKRSNGPCRNPTACEPAPPSDRSPETASEVLLPNHLHLSTINPVQTVRNLPGSYHRPAPHPSPLPAIGERGNSGPSRQPPFAATVA